MNLATSESVADAMTTQRSLKIRPLYPASKDKSVESPSDRQDLFVLLNRLKISEHPESIANLERQIVQWTKQQVDLDLYDTFWSEYNVPSQGR